MYDRSTLITLDNYGNVMEKIKKNSLIYIFESPNYCQQNVIPGWNGTHSRECSRNRSKDVTRSEKQSCKKLCRSCGWHIKKLQEVQTKRCNCKFNWCCNVTCDVCNEVVEKFYCN